jgi:FSR family fosmidomycin resistance protein-like MFS transporter
MFRSMTTLRAVSYAHFAVDVLNGLNAVVLTFISAHFLPMTKTEIGLLLSLYSLFASLSQPLFGFLADRDGGRRIALVGVVWLPAFLIAGYFALMVTSSYWLMLVLLVTGALGSGAFHPVGTMHATDGSASRAARGLSWFFMSGQFGFAVAPVIIGWLLDRTLVNGEGGSLLPVLLFVPLSIPAYLWMRRTLPSRASYAETHPKEARTKLSLVLPKREIGLVAFVVALRSLSTPAAAAFIALLFAERGWSPEAYGLAVTLFWLTSAFTPIAASRMAERYGGKAIIAVSLLLAAPMFWLLPASDGIAAFIISGLAGGLSGASHSLIIAQGQRMMPARKGFASGLTMGFLFSVGAIGSLILGALSDRVGLTVTFEIVAVVTAIAALTGLLLPDLGAARAPQPVKLATAGQAGD